jgi:hypothetical protein
VFEEGLAGKHLGNQKGVGHGGKEQSELSKVSSCHGLI